MSTGPSFPLSERVHILFTASPQGVWKVWFGGKTSIFKGTSKISELIFYTACAVRVTIFSTGGKFCPVSIFT